MSPGEGSCSRNERRPNPTSSIKRKANRVSDSGHLQLNDSRLASSFSYFWFGNVLLGRTGTQNGISLLLPGMRGESGAISGLTCGPGFGLECGPQVGPGFG